MNNANNIMKQLPREQRPYEKCFMQGEGSLNDTELLAVILRSGTSGKNSLALAQEILKFMESSSYPGLMGLMHVSVQDLMKIHGIGQVKAVQLKCIGELSKRIAKAAASRSKRSLYCRRKRNPRFPSDTGSQKERFLCKIQERQNCQINAVRHIN